MKDYRPGKSVNFMEAGKGISFFKFQQVENDRICIQEGNSGCNMEVLFGEAMNQKQTVSESVEAIQTRGLGGQPRVAVF